MATHVMGHHYIDMNHLHGSFRENGETVSIRNSIHINNI